MGLMGRILRCRRGTAAIESALIFPALVMVLMGMVELTHYLEATRKAMSAAQTVADLVAQEATQDDDSLDDIRTAATLILQPLDADTSTLTLVIASIGFDEGEDLRTLWQHSSGDASVTIDPEIADGLSSANESVIVVRLVFEYESPFGFLFSAHTLNEVAVSRPRIARRIALNGETDQDS